MERKPLAKTNPSITVGKGKDAVLWYFLAADFYLIGHVSGVLVSPRANTCSVRLSCSLPLPFPSTFTAENGFHLIKSFSGQMTLNDFSVGLIVVVIDLLPTGVSVCLT